MAEEKIAAVKSVVQVQFEGANIPLSYINDAFDLKAGDYVFVEGKFEGQRGQVTAVNRNFKIRLSDYKRVVGKADTEVSGELFMAGSHFVSFDRNVIPYEKIRSWYKAPASEDEYATGSDASSFTLDNFEGFNVKKEIFERGHSYYLQNRVRYICVDDGVGKAIVEGSKAYEVEFRYEDGEISGLVCDCFCNYTCKHEVAAMLQLRETLDIIEDAYEDVFWETDYFAVLHMATFFLMTVDGKKNGRLHVGGAEEKA